MWRAFVAEKRLNAARRSDPIAVSVSHLRSSNILPTDRVSAKLACDSMFSTNRAAT